MSCLFRNDLSILVAYRDRRKLKFKISVKFCQELQRIACQLWSTIIHIYRLSSSSRNSNFFEMFFVTSWSNCHTFLYLLLKLCNSLCQLEFVRNCQSFVFATRFAREHFATRIRDAFIVRNTHNKTSSSNVVRSARFEDFDLIKYINLTFFLSNFRFISRASLEMIIFIVVDINELSITTFNSLACAQCHDQSRESDNVLSFFEKVLRDVKEVKKSQHVISSVDQWSEKVDDSIEHRTQINCDDFDIVKNKKMKTSAKNQESQQFFVSTIKTSQLKSKARSKILSILYIILMLNLKFEYNFYNLRLLVLMLTKICFESFHSSWETFLLFRYHHYHFVAIILVNIRQSENSIDDALKVIESIFFDEEKKKTNINDEHNEDNDNRDENEQKVKERCALLARKLWEFKKRNVENEKKIKCMKSYRWRDAHVRYDDEIFEKSINAMNVSLSTWVTIANTRYSFVFEWTFLDDEKLWKRYSYMSCNITFIFF